MRHLREMMFRTRSSFSRIMGGFNERMKTLEISFVAQSQRITDLEANEGVTIQAMELSEHNRQEFERARRSGLSDWDLALDLEKQYGTSKWAMKLINEMLAHRNV